jgi:NAD-dependent dihydropyrimidine dehydrogenase PreA subunit
MRTRQSGRRNKGPHRMHAKLTGKGTCVCPNCGYNRPHIPGVPCRTEECPNCHIPLTRNDSGNKDLVKRNGNISSQLKSDTKDFPKVNSDICTGCGICIDNCPMEAIELVNGVAFIDGKKCNNCHQCENDCPVEAIS